MEDTTQYLLLCYFSLAFIKLMLCLPALPTFIGVMSRIAGCPKGTVSTRFMVTLPIFLVATTSVLWVYSMYIEGFAFFSMYTKRQIMRQCLSANRA